MQVKFWEEKFGPAGLAFPMTGVPVAISFFPYGPCMVTVISQQLKYLHRARTVRALCMHRATPSLKQFYTKLTSKDASVLVQHFLGPMHTGLKLAH